ncbi:MAG: hypothetical protein O3A84_04560 [Proteobacteria bacterium]|nr:hypothetical protein [Pseudomonadota bacterium]
MLDPEKLKPDCDSCDGLCCVSPVLDLPHYQKPAAQPCKNLDVVNLRCRIFETLEDEGYPFCRAFDCHGAGPAVTALFREVGRSWRNDADAGKVEFDVFNIVYATLHRRLADDPPLITDVTEEHHEALRPFIDAVLIWLSDHGADEVGDHFGVRTDGTDAER